MKEILQIYLVMLREQQRRKLNLNSLLNRFNLQKSQWKIHHHQHNNNHSHRSKKKKKAEQQHSTTCLDWNDDDIYDSESHYEFQWFYVCINQIKLHLESFSFFFILGCFICRAILIASSKTSFNPSCVRALHSRYFELSSSSMIFLATSFLMNVFGSSCSFLKSILLPTNNLLEPFANSSSSGNH